MYLDMAGEGMKVALLSVVEDQSIRKSKKKKKKELTLWSLSDI